MTASKKKITLSMLTVLTAILFIGGTLAFFMDKEKVTNTFTVGNLDIKLDEEWDPEDGTLMIPGDTVVQKPVVTAVDGSGYMRVILKVIDQNQGVADGTTVKDAKRLEKIMKTIRYDSAGSKIKAGEIYSEADLSSTASAVNTKDFELVSEKNGVYIFAYKGGTNSIFKQGTSATLFTNVVIPVNWNQEDLSLLGKYAIQIQAEAIQSEGFKNRTEAFNALDKQIAQNSD